MKKERTVHTQYHVSNLEELRDMLDDILSSARALRGQRVHPSEIALTTQQCNFVGFLFEEQKLTDGSTVFNVEAAAEPVIPSHIDNPDDRQICDPIAEERMDAADIELRGGGKWPF